MNQSDFTFSKIFQYLSSLSDQELLELNEEKYVESLFFVYHGYSAK